MAQALLYVADTVSAYVASYTGSTFLASTAFYATLGAEVYTASYAASALGPKTPNPEAQRATVRQTIPPRTRGCGHMRVGGPLLLDYSSGNVLNQVVAFCDCKLSNITRHYISQDHVTLSGNTVQQMANNAYPPSIPAAKLYTAYGVTGTQAFASSLGTEFGGIWPSNAYGTGISMGYARFQNGKLEKFNADFPRGNRPQYNVVGDVNTFYDWRISGVSRTDEATWSASSNPVVILVNELWRYRGYDWDTCFAPSLDVLTTAANACDTQVPVRVNLAQLTQNASSGATSVHLETAAGLSSGMTIYIAGQSFTVSGSPSSDGVGGYTVGLSSSLVASVALGSVAKWYSNTSSPVQKALYTANGVWSSDEDESATVRRLLSCFDGFMSRRGSDNAVIIEAGVWTEPDVIFTERDVVDYTYQPFATDAQVKNEIAPSFISPAHDYNQVDTQVVQDTDDISIRGRSSDQLFGELVQSNNQIMRLAKIALARASTPTEMIKVRYRPGKAALGKRRFRMQLGLDEIDAYRDVYMEVVGSPKIVDNGMHIQFPVKRVTSAMYTFDWQTEEGTGPSDGASPIIQGLSQPTITSVTPYYSTSSAGTIVQLAIVAGGPSRTDLTWYWRWKGSADTAYVQGVDQSASGAMPTLNTAQVTPNDTLSVEVAYTIGNGTLSDWSDPTSVDTSTASIAPAIPTDAAASTGGSAGQINLTWRNPSSSNFDHVVIRRSAASDMSSPTTLASQYGAPGASGALTDTGLTTGTTYYYDFAAANASGTLSARTAPVIASAA